MRGMLVLAVAWGTMGLVGAAQAQLVSLVADPKACRVGDALTVLVQESASAINSSATSTDKSNQTKITSDVPGAPNLLRFVPLHSLQSDLANQFKGQASTSRSATVLARVTVTVVGRKPNGDLIVEGVRTLKINGETEAIYVSGSVNPAFVGRDNTVLSSSIADLQVEYTGNGTVSQGNRPGLLVRLINWVF